MGNVIEQNYVSLKFSEESFCELIDSIESYWRMCQDLEDILNINVIESPLLNLMNKVTEVLTKAFYDDYVAYHANPYWIDDISYYMWELDFGKKWKPETITGADGEDIPLKNSHDLWKILTARLDDEFGI